MYDHHGIADFHNEGCSEDLNTLSRFEDEGGMEKKNSQIWNL